MSNYHIFHLNLKDFGNFISQSLNVKLSGKKGRGVSRSVVYLTKIQLVRIYRGLKNLSPAITGSYRNKMPYKITEGKTEITMPKFPMKSRCLIKKLNKSE